MVTALQAVVMKINTLADGTIRLTVDLTTDDLAEVAALSPVHQTIAIAPIQAQAALNGSDQAYSENSTQGSPKPEKSLTNDSRANYGMLAKELKLSGFFRIESVYSAIGSDRDFLAWIRQRGKSATGKQPTPTNPIEAAHVRKVGSGAGMAYKPHYSAIPLLHTEHHIQHAQGESVIGDSEWWQQQRIRYLEQWAWERLKENLGYESWRDVPPADLAHWASLNNLENYLPQVYRESLSA